MKPFFDCYIPLEAVTFWLHLICPIHSLFEKSQFGLWSIETLEGSEAIGFTGLWYFFEENQNQPQLINALLPDATEQGYGTEAARKVLEYGFDRLDYQYCPQSLLIG